MYLLVVKYIFRKFYAIFCVKTSYLENTFVCYFIVLEIEILWVHIIALYSH